MEKYTDNAYTEKLLGENKKLLKDIQTLQEKIQTLQEENDSLKRENYAYYDNLNTLTYDKPVFDHEKEISKLKEIIKILLA